MSYCAWTTLWVASVTSLPDLNPTFFCGYKLVKVFFLFHVHEVWINVMFHYFSLCFSPLIFPTVISKLWWHIIKSFKYSIPQPWVHIRITWRPFEIYKCPSPTQSQLRISGSEANTSFFSTSFYEKTFQVYREVERIVYWLPLYAV